LLGYNTYIGTFGCRPTAISAAGQPTPAGIRRSEGDDMILVIILGILALFSLISIVLDSDEPRRSDSEAQTYDWYLMRFGAR
jgi:hypothetical protein